MLSSVEEEEEEEDRTLVICWVKTGKNIVTAKVRKTAVER